jgi:hypothetical protein
MLTIEDALQACGEVATADGFDDAIIGIIESYGMGEKVLYDLDKVLVILQERDGMSYEEACDYYAYNMLGAGITSSETGECISPAFLFMRIGDER